MSGSTYYAKIFPPKPEGVGQIINEVVDNVLSFEEIHILVIDVPMLSCLQPWYITRVPANALATDLLVINIPDVRALSESCRMRISRTERDTCQRITTGGYVYLRTKLDSFVDSSTWEANCKSARSRASRSSSIDGGMTG